MDVIFDKGISFSYFGDTQDGWYLEGCFTCIDCEKIKENCWGSGHLIPKLGISNILLSHVPQNQTLGCREPARNVAVKN